VLSKLLPVEVVRFASSSQLTDDQDGRGRLRGRHDCGLRRDFGQLGSEVLLAHGTSTSLPLRRGRLATLALL
jgi:hypothetical protein